MDISMKRLLLLLFLVSCFCVETNSKRKYVIQKESLCYDIGASRIECDVLTIVNDSSDDLWIWFSPDSIQRGDEQEIKVYLNKRKSDFSLFDLVAGEPSFDIDHGVRFESRVYESFIKRLKCKERFVVVVLNSRLQCVEKHLRVFEQALMQRYAPRFMSEERNLQWVCYPHSQIVFP